MRRKRAIQRAAGQFRGEMACFDGAKQCCGTELILDEPSYLWGVLIAARRRMDRNFEGEQSQARPSWLRQVVGNRIVRWYRLLVKPRGPAPGSDGGDPLVNVSAVPSDQSVVNEATGTSTRVAFDLENDRLRKALGLLEPGDLELLMLRHVDQISITQIALTLGITERAAKDRLLRALLRLRELMDR